MENWPTPVWWITGSSTATPCPTWTELFEQGLVADTIEVATSWHHIAPLYTAVIEAISAVPTVIAATAHTSHAYQSGANLYFTFAAQPSDPSEYQSVYDVCWAAAMQGGGLIAVPASPTITASAAFAAPG